jgi:hypothetical protein
MGGGWKRVIFENVHTAVDDHHVRGKDMPLFPRVKKEDSLSAAKKTREVLIAISQILFVLKMR